MCGTELSNCLSSYIFSRCAGILAFVLAILHMGSQCLLSKSVRNSNRNTKVEDEEEPALLNNSDLWRHSGPQGLVQDAMEMFPQEETIEILFIVYCSYLVTIASLNWRAPFSKLFIQPIMIWYLSWNLMLHCAVNISSPINGNIGTSKKNCS